MTDSPLRSLIVRRSFWFLAFVFLAIAGTLISSQHRVRLIIGSYGHFEDREQKTLEDMRFMVPRGNLLNGDFSKAVALLASIRQPTVYRDPMPAIDNPDTCLALLENAKMLHCYNVDIGAAAFLAHANIFARMWDLCGPNKLGGDGHNVLEVYDGAAHSWKVLDPFYHCYFIRPDSVPMSLPELRRALLTGTPVAVVHYAHSAYDRPDPYILSEYRYLVPFAMVHENNDFGWRYAHRYAWLTPAIAPMIDGLPLRVSRGARMFLLGSDDRRDFIHDALAPHYHIHRIKWMFWTLLAMAGISGVLACTLTPRKPRPKREPVPNKDAVSANAIV